jgi:hypothetical protein
MSQAEKTTVPKDISRREFIKRTSEAAATGLILSKLPRSLTAGELRAVGERPTSNNSPEIEKPLEQKLWFYKELVRIMADLQDAHTTCLAELFTQLAEKAQKEEVPYVQLEVTVNDIDNQLRSLVQDFRRQIDRVMGAKDKSGIEILRLPVVEVKVSGSRGVEITDHRFDADFMAKKPSRPEPFLNQPVKSWADLEKLITSQHSTNPEQQVKAKLTIEKGVKFQEKALTDQLNDALPQIFMQGGVQKEFGVLFKEGTVALKLDMDVTVEFNVFADGSFALEIKTPEYQDMTPETVSNPSLEDLVPSSEIPVGFTILGNAQGITKAFVQFGAVKKFLDGHGQPNIDTNFSSRVPLPLELAGSLVKWVESFSK